MLYKNCHYKHKDRICELIDFLPESDGSDGKVKIKYTNGKETICFAPELSEIPLTEAILQSCYKSKIYVRDGNWDIIWHLGGRNNVTIGENSGHYYLFPIEKSEAIVDILPYEIVASPNNLTDKEVKELRTLNTLEKFFPEIGSFLE